MNSRPDIVATSLNWNTAQSGVDFGYKVTEADLTQNTTAALYWASGPTFADAIGGPVYDTPVDHPQGSYGPFYIPNGTVLGMPPANATHLLLVVDPPSTSQPDGAINESDETNNVLALPIPNINVQSVTTDDSRSVKVSYTVEGIALDPIPVRVYRSADDKISPDDDVVGDFVVPGTLGDHTGANAVPLQLGAPLAINPSKPFVIAMADPDNQILEMVDSSQTNLEADNAGHFRKRVLGVVTHGFQLLGQFGVGFPGWITDMAADLRNGQHYDRTIAFDWASQSNLLLPGQTVDAASRLAQQIELQMQQMAAVFPGDVIDIHLIGHSRGAVVIDQALVNPRLLNNPDVIRGTVKMTMLDPHSARNYSGTQFYSILPPGLGLLSTLGRVAENVLRAFQAVANDPPLFLPPNADIAEDYYQRTPALQLLTTHPLEAIINFWGEGPFAWANNYPELTALGGVGHSEVHDWYAQNILPNLGTGGGWGGGGPHILSRPSVNTGLPSDPMPTAKEVRTFLRTLSREIADARSAGYRIPPLPSAHQVLAALKKPGFWTGVSEATSNFASADRLGLV